MRYSHHTQDGMIYIECEAGACRSVYALTELELREFRCGWFPAVRRVYRYLRRTVALMLQEVQR